MAAVSRSPPLPERLETTLVCPEICPVSPCGSERTKRQKHVLVDRQDRAPGASPALTCVSVASCYLATGTSDGHVVLWALETRCPVQTLVCSRDGMQAPELSIRDVTWSADGRFLVASAWGEGKEEGKSPKGKGKSPKGKGEGEGRIMVWNVGEGGAATAVGSVGIPAKGALRVDVFHCCSEASRDGEVLRVLVTDVEGGRLHWVVVYQGAAGGGNEENLSVRVVPVEIPSSPSSVGSRIEVYWEEDRAWYPGTVGQVDETEGKMHVYYDDSELIWEDRDGETQWRTVEGTVSSVQGTSASDSLTTKTLLTARCGESKQHLALCDVLENTLRLYLVGPTGTLEYLDEMKLILPMEEQRGIRAADLAASPDGENLVVVYPQGSVVGVRVESGRPKLSKVLSLSGNLDFDSRKKGTSKKPENRNHIWNACSFSPDSTHVFCSLAIDTKEEQYGVLTWDFKSNRAKNLLQAEVTTQPSLQNSQTSQTPLTPLTPQTPDTLDTLPTRQQRVVAMCVHPDPRPMQLFALTEDGTVGVWSSILSQDWSVFQPDFVSFTQNRMHIEQEDDFDVCPVPVSSSIRTDGDREGDEEETLVVD
jgi:WD40 repeat protein